MQYIHALKCFNIFSKLRIMANRDAFTLAEILVTLGIIGVIAAMVIPTMVNNIQEQIYISAWKKEYSVVSQAYAQILAENGGSIKNLNPNVDWQTDSVNLITLFKDKMKVIKFCPETNGTTFTCWHPYDNEAEAVHDKQENKVIFYANKYPAMILQDGALFHLFGGKSDCSNSNLCAYIAIDTNGKKGPNIIGKDVFEIKMFENKLYPFGSQGYGYENTCDTTGFGCAAEYLSK